MGHIRLGALSRTRKWQAVVALLAGGAGANQIANATIRAAERDLSRAGEDKGLVEVVWLLTQLPQVARSEDFPCDLRRCGLAVSDSPGLMELLAAFTEAVDHRLANNCGRTDLGEMAQTAAVEAITSAIGARTNTLFGTTPEDVQAAFAELATVKRFGTFARTFFARLTTKILDYFLSRVMSHHVGEGQRFTTLAQQAEFTQALETHCKEASLIVEKFSGQWLSKTNWERGGISRSAASRFANHAFTKLVDELKQGGACRWRLSVRSSAAKFPTGGSPSRTPTPCGCACGVGTATST
jgi:hypothetical protein